MIKVHTTVSPFVYKMDIIKEMFSTLHKYHKSCTMEKEMGQTHSKTAIWYLQKAATVTKTLSYCSRSPTSIDKHNWGKREGRSAAG